jgi:hypothetical protein
MAVLSEFRELCMARRVRNNLRFALLLGSSLGLASGCGSNTAVVTEPKDKAERVQESSLAQLGDLLRLRKEDSGKPPTAETDLARYEKVFPLGYGKVKRGEVVLVYGASLQEGVADKVLAYDKQVPDSGGYVLMQDGTTVKKMTAEEFKAAQKASKG